MMWFQTLTGFHEQSPDQVRNNLVVSGERMRSVVNGRSMLCGRLETPSLEELRARVREVAAPAGRLKLYEVVGDVQKLHCDLDNADAMFQVASQFNLLEMVSPSRTPEDGVGIYEHDRTQGPACAIACGAGTIYRNYFAPTNVQLGQSSDNQIDCLRDLGIALGNDHQILWTMQNGYAMATADGLAKISERLSNADEPERDRYRSKLRIGLQWNSEVTLAQTAHTVSQIYCSALPVSYSTHASRLWANFAQLVLEAAYEATFCAAILNLVSTGNPKLFLTLLGGGAFGNDDDWIFAAIERSLGLFAKFALEVSIVSYGSSKPRVRGLRVNDATD